MVDGSGPKSQLGSTPLPITPLSCANLYSVFWASYQEVWGDLRELLHDTNILSWINPDLSGQQVVCSPGWSLKDAVWYSIDGVIVVYLASPFLIDCWLWCHKGERRERRFEM